MAVKNQKSEKKSMKCGLTIDDRFSIQSLLPQDGNLIEQMQAKSILKKVDFSSEEIEEFELDIQQNGAPVWNSEKEKDLEVEFTTGEIELLHTGVKLKDSAKQLKQYQVDIALKVKEWAGYPVKM